jgi:hypothetical protein
MAKIVANAHLSLNSVVETAEQWTAPYFSGETEPTDRHSIRPA